MSSVGENEKRNRKDRKKRKKRGRKRKEKGRKGGPAYTSLQCSNNERFNELGSELVYAQKVGVLSHIEFVS